MDMKLLAAGIAVLAGIGAGIGSWSFRSNSYLWISCFNNLIIRCLISNYVLFIKNL